MNYSIETSNSPCYEQTPSSDNEFDLAVDQLLGDVDPSMEKVNLDEIMRSEPVLEDSTFAIAEPIAVMEPVNIFPQRQPQNSSAILMEPIAVHRVDSVNSVPFALAQQQEIMPQHEEEPVEELPKPKRALSAYNMFFQCERKRILKSLPKPVGKTKKGRKAKAQMGFTDMARMVAARWKTISKEDKMEYEYLAAMDGERYEKEMAEWKRSQSMSALSTQNRSRPSVTNFRGYASCDASMQPLQSTFGGQQGNAEWQNDYSYGGNNNTFLPMNASKNMFLQQL
uniref:HMG box domain-containing protein n=1 Tax=Entomoneis paludosa TaxID=265537 RepID=A0A6U3E7G9_9STRA